MVDEEELGMNDLYMENLFSDDELPEKEYARRKKDAKILENINRLDMMQEALPQVSKMVEELKDLIKQNLMMASEARMSLLF